MKKLNKKGFTIVELVIVIAVIAILAGVMIPSFSYVIGEANKTAAEAKASEVYKNVYAKDALDGKMDYNIVPADLDLAAGTFEYGEDTFTYNHTNGYTATLTIATGVWATDKTPASQNP